MNRQELIDWIESSRNMIKKLDFTDVSDDDQADYLRTLMFKLFKEAESLLEDVSVSEKVTVPGKVKVPQFVADWIIKHWPRDKWEKLERFMCDYNSVKLPDELYNYYDNNSDGAREKVISAILNDYEVEQEPKWVIPLLGLVTSDGCQQYLSYDPKNNTYFASKKSRNVKREFTKKELEDVSEIYRQQAIPVEPAEVE